MLPPIVINQHAREAMMLRRVSMDEILAVLRTPEVTDTDRFGNTRYFRDKICVVTKRAANGKKIFVKTVLYRYGDQWTDKDVRTRDLK
jgi:hypothetical protein